MANKFFNSLLGSGGSSFNPDAQAFITAAGITDPTQITAINDLVNGLQADNLWSLFYAIYPIVGGTASNHKYNLINPADTDGAYRLSFSGGLTHSSTGITPNGSTGFANTFLAPSIFADGDNAWSYYSRTDISAATAVFGAQGATSKGPTAYLRNTILGPSNILVDYFAGISDRLSSSEADSLGLHTFSATGGLAGTFIAYKRGVQIGASASVNAESLSTVTNPFYLFGVNQNGVLAVPTTRECAWAGFSSGLDATQAANLETLVTAYQTTLSRQV